MLGGENGHLFEDPANPANLEQVRIRCWKYVDSLHCMYDDDGTTTGYHGGQGGREQIFFLDTGDSSFPRLIKFVDSLTPFQTRP